MVHIFLWDSVEQLKTTRMYMKDENFLNYRLVMFRHLCVTHSFLLRFVTAVTTFQQEVPAYPMQWKGLYHV